MHTGSECSPRINMKNHLVLVFFFYLFPGWNDQNIVHIELMEKLFPVVNPVFVLSLGFFNRRLTDIHKGTKFFQCISDITKNGFFICIFFKIKIQISNAVIRRSFRHDVNKHLCFIFFGQWLVILNLHTFHTDFCKSTDDHVFCFCFCLNGKTIPFHIL